jgi:CubicO group peptidase (beta-lactamase class C family)
MPSRARSESLPPPSEATALALARLVRSHQAERRAPSFATAVFRGEELLWSDAVGVADIEAGTRATVDMQYRIGSITKTFTAVAVMQLRDAGELSLDDPLAAHVPEAKHEGPTIRRLLAHLSGLQREPPGEIWETMLDPSVEELLAALDDAERVLHPGAYWHYSNLGFALLGEIVSRRSGMRAVDYISQRVLEPLGLTRTTWAADAPNAQGYHVAPYTDTAQRESHVELNASAPIGQLWSTVGDLAKWGAFLAAGDDRVLPEKSVREMHAFQAMVPYLKSWTMGYGLGVALYRDDDRVLVGHGGAMPGFLAGLVVSPEDGIGAVALANSSAGAFAESLAVKLARRAYELEPADADEWRVGEPPPEPVAALLGRWWSEGVEWIFSWRKGALEATPAESQRGALETTVFEADGDDRFRPVSGLERGELLRVVRDEQGVPTRLYWATYPFTRAPEIFGAEPTPDREL